MSFLYISIIGTTLSYNSIWDYLMCRVKPVPIVRLNWLGGDWVTLAWVWGCRWVSRGCSKTILVCDKDFLNMQAVIQCRGCFCKLRANSISNVARKLCLVVYSMNSTVSVNTLLMNICYLFNELQKKWINILYIGNDAHLLSECKHWRERICCYSRSERIYAVPAMTGPVLKGWGWAEVHICWLFYQCP